MKMVSALAVRKRLGNILDEVAKGKGPIAITRANRPLVVMESYEGYEARTSRAARQGRLLELTRQMDAWSKRNARFLKGFHAVEAIRQMRDTR